MAALFFCRAAGKGKNKRAARGRLKSAPPLAAERAHAADNDKQNRLFEFMSFARRYAQPNEAHCARSLSALEQRPGPRPEVSLAGPLLAAPDALGMILGLVDGALASTRLNCGRRALSSSDCFSRTLQPEPAGAGSPPLSPPRLPSGAPALPALQSPHRLAGEALGRSRRGRRALLSRRSA